MTILRNTCPMCSWVLQEFDFGRALIRAGSHSMNCPRKDEICMPYEACPVGTPVVDLTQARRIKFKEFEYWGLWVEGSSCVYGFLNEASTHPVSGIPLDPERPNDIDNARDAMRTFVRGWEALRDRKNRALLSLGQPAPEILPQSHAVAPDLDVGQYGKQEGPGLFDSL